ncbi:ScbR family autoregulator-binding transcription factor [Streptomyces sp. NPDC059477]|uniref:ScbR family autoregulator-binding transcription factor n=1 Tax=Streptomyces sp. NPDC059477 TaxID=3346847 RepID=UPI0036887F2E
MQSHRESQTESQESYRHPTPSRVEIIPSGRYYSKRPSSNLGDKTVITPADAAAAFALPGPPLETGPVPRQPRALRTKAHVLYSAAAVFSAHGFNGTSIQDVADHSGLTKGAVYHHFGSKETLARAIVEEQYRRWGMLVTEVGAENGRLIERVREVLDRAARALRDDLIIQAGVRLQTEHSLAKGTLPTPFVGWMKILTEYLTEAVEAGELRERIDPSLAAYTLVSAFFGLQHVSASLNDRDDLLERWATSSDILFFGLIRCPEHQQDQNPG